MNRLSYIEDASCLKVNYEPEHAQILRESLLALLCIPHYTLNEVLHLH